MLFNPSFSLPTQDPSQTICYYFLIVTHLKYLKLSLEDVYSLSDDFRSRAVSAASSASNRPPAATTGRKLAAPFSRGFK